ncbi:MAG: hypothetical protein AB8E15_01435 [Bdellovibrionales bacterium]
MKILLIGLLLFSSIPSFSNSSSDKIDMINDIIDSNTISVDQYHYGRLKGYLEALMPEKGYFLKSSLTETHYRMNLVALKSILNNVKTKYPDIEIKNVIKKISINGNRNNLGTCFFDSDLELRIAVREFTGKKFTVYTVNAINSCIRSVTKKIEDNL